jgi:site-specific DNA-adenine methylase
VGGKSKAATLLSSHIPDRLLILVSPFFGGGGFEMTWKSRDPRRSVLAFDADFNLINMYRCVQSDKEGVRAALAELTADSFASCAALLKSPPKGGDELRRAAAKIYSHKMSFAGWARAERRPRTWDG